MKNINEKCAVFGIFNAPLMASRQTFFGLFALQHRGQEQTGIASTDGKKIFAYKNSGLVNQVYTEKIIKKLAGRKSNTTWNMDGLVAKRFR